MRKIPVFVSLALVGPSLLATPLADATTPDPEKHGYVVNQLLVPTTNDQARAYAFDIDKDGEVDNQLGYVFSVLASQGLDLQGAMDASIDSGAVVMLLSVQTTSLTNAKGVKVRLLRGLPVANPDLNGGGRFRVDKSAPRTELKGKIKNRVLTTKPGAVSLSLPPLYPGFAAIPFDLLKGRIRGTCKTKRCTKGIIGGAITSEDLDARFVPAIADMARAIVARDCPTTPPDDCPPSTDGQTMLNLFDENDDKVITNDEVRENPLIKTLLAPDLDVVGKDGVKDAMSVGFGFTARWAKIRGD